MPLLDHFSEPIDVRREWESFHSYWAAAIGRSLNDTLPKRFFAAVQTHRGRTIEADVLELDLGPQHEGNGDGGGLALQTYAPPRATAVFPAVFPDEMEIPILDQDRGGKLVAAIELISPSNKHDPASRRTFAGKCATYQANGVGLLIVDVVANMHFNLHDEFIELLQLAEEFRMPADTSTYAASYRPVRRQGSNQVDCWMNCFSVGEDLPTLPLALKGWGCIPIDLEETYTEARRNSRLV